MLLMCTIRVGKPLHLTFLEEERAGSLVGSLPLLPLELQLPLSLLLSVLSRSLLVLLRRVRGDTFHDRSWASVHGNVRVGERQGKRSVQEAEAWKKGGDSQYAQCCLATAIATDTKTQSNLDQLLSTGFNMVASVSGSNCTSHLETREGRCWAVHCFYRQ